MRQIGIYPKTLGTGRLGVTIDRTSIAAEVDVYDDAARSKRRLRTIWRIPDDLWVELQPLLPPEKPPGTPGRPVVPFRRVMDGILYVLRTGCQWKACPGNMGPAPRATGGSRRGSRPASSSGCGASC
jgi:hypothetical protein